MVKQAIDLKDPWIDEYFPPEASSLYDPDVDLKSDASVFENLEWRRASEIYPDCEIFKDGIDPNDIN